MADVRWLREPVANITVARDAQGTQEPLLSKLSELGIPSEVSSSPPRVVANCITLCANYFLWRCWADRLEFQLEAVDAGHTNVHVVALPNLFITRPHPHHVKVEIDALVSGLRTE